MLDIHGKLIRVGDSLRIDGDFGRVVCCIDTGEYSVEFPQAEWEYLERGIMVDTDKAGLIHFTEKPAELEILPQFQRTRPPLALTPAARSDYIAASRAGRLGPRVLAVAVGR